MPQVDFDDDDASRLLALLRARVIAAGLGFVDDAAVERDEGSPAKTGDFSARQRLQDYIITVEKYIATHTTANLENAVASIQEQLDGGQLAAAVVELPEGERIDGERFVRLDQLMISPDQAREFLAAFREIAGLVYDGYLPDPEGPDGPTP